jgi:hypothetical protein
LKSEWKPPWPHNLHSTHLQNQHHVDSTKVCCHQSSIQVPLATQWLQWPLSARVAEHGEISTEETIY